MQQAVALVWTYLPHLLPATKKPRIHKSKTGFMDARDTRFGNLPALVFQLCSTFGAIDGPFSAACTAFIAFYGFLQLV